VDAGAYIHVVQVVQDTSMGSYSSGRVVELQVFAIYFCFYSQWTDFPVWEPFKEKHKVVKHLGVGDSDIFQ
jgi:hypothetical protein